MAESAEPGSEPRWIRDAFAAAEHEARLYLKTAWTFTARPRRFAREWSSGALFAMNPFAFLATSAAAVGTATQLVSRLLARSDEPNPLWRELVFALTPYLYYAALGLVSHGLLRLTGKARRLTSTVAMALYAGGGPATLAALVLQGLTALLQPPAGAFLPGVAPQYRAVASVAIFGSFLAFPIAFAAAMSTLHGASKLRTALSVVGGLVVLGLLLGPAHFRLGMVHFRVGFQRGWPVPDLYW